MKYAILVSHFICFGILTLSFLLLESKVECTVEKTTINENNFMAVILVLDYAMCGGTIVNEKFIITSSSCLLNCETGHCPPVEPSIYKVFVGTTYSPLPNKPDFKEVEQIYYHPDMKMTDFQNRCKWNFDIALLKLKYPLEFGDTIGKVNLTIPVKKDKPLKKSFRDCVVLGWGYNDTEKEVLKDNTLNRQLKWSRVFVEISNYCHDYIVNNNNVSFPKSGFCKSTEICSVSVNITVCPGDKGGPLICSGQQIGILTKTSEQCITDNLVSQYNMYARVDISREWINSVTGKSVNSFCVNKYQIIFQMFIYLCLIL